MFQNIAQVRKWLVGSAIGLLVVVTVSYYVAKLKVRPTLHTLPQKLGIDIQQTKAGARFTPYAPPMPSSSRRAATPI